MKGYWTDSGYMGYDPYDEKYFLYANEEEYREDYIEKALAWTD